jgi:hypothetical protein
MEGEEPSIFYPPPHAGAGTKVRINIKARYFRNENRNKKKNY